MSEKAVDLGIHLDFPVFPIVSMTNDATLGHRNISMLHRLIVIDETTAEFLSEFLKNFLGYLSLLTTNVDLLYYLADNLWDIFEKSSHNMYIVHELRQVYSCSWIWV